MTELRTILIIIGIIILVSIYLIGTRNERARRKQDLPDIDKAFRSRDEAGTDQPLDEGLAEELNRLGSIINADRGGAVEQSDATGPAASEVAHTEIPNQPDKIVNLFLLCQKGHFLDIKRIHEAAEDVGMTFGDMKIYHRVSIDHDDHTAIFSMANVSNPGTFDHSEHMLTPGVCLFMTLPNSLSALDAWDTMLATAQRLSTLLEADLLDDSQSTLSRQRIAHIRDEMRQYDQQIQQ